MDFDKSKLLVSGAPRRGKKQSTFSIASITDGCRWRGASGKLEQVSLLKMACQICTATNILPLKFSQIYRLKKKQQKKNYPIWYRVPFVSLYFWHNNRQKDER